MSSNYIRELRVLETKFLGTRGRVLRIKKDLSFSPGQVLGLRLNNCPFRYYSISSNPSVEYYEVLYTIVDDGLLTPQLSLLKCGDTLQISGPQGSFLSNIGRDRNMESRHWCIANGTGIAPFVSLLLNEPTLPIGIIHGVRSESEAWYYDTIKEVVKPGQYVVCLSQPDLPLEFSESKSGRLTAWIKGNLGTILQANDYFYLCGAEGMIIEVRELLMNGGVQHERISSEIYF